MRSAWRRREYFGGAHRPEFGFLCGTNGLLRTAAAVAKMSVPLRVVMVVVGGRAAASGVDASGRWG